MHDEAISLVGEFRLNIIVSSSGRADCYLIYGRHASHTFGRRIVAKSQVYLSDDELLTGDWPALLERVVMKVTMG